MPGRLLESLRGLLNFETSTGGKLLQIILLGMPQIKRKFRSDSPALDRASATDIAAPGWHPPAGSRPPASHSTPHRERTAACPLRDFLIEAHAQGKTNVLIVDEAHRMKPPLSKLLRQLLNFETSTAKLLQIVLFGQNELGVKIARQPELKDRVTIFGALTSLTREDAEPLIAFRWQVAGGGEHPFAPEVLEAIFKYSCSLPFRIYAVKALEQLGWSLAEQWLDDYQNHQPPVLRTQKAGRRRNIGSMRQRWRMVRCSNTTGSGPPHPYERRRPC